MASDWFKNSSHITKFIFVLIILYAASTVAILVAALVMIASIHRIFLNPYVTLIYAIISFGLTILVSAYHLSTMLRRRKRKTDHIEAQAAA